MLRNKFLLKSVSIFLLLEMLCNIIAPSISWALTSGPTMPEFSSFEPVDTTDMVNLATGELIYNTPLLEVPGPSGGYPLSLSYHAGIKPETEASWVGLGFTLNPGAINRTVNGVADDNYNVRKEVRDYWAGGESLTKAYSLGISAPNMGIGLSWTRTVTRDTYRGFSTNNYYGVSVNPVTVGLNVFGKQLSHSLGEERFSKLLGISQTLAGLGIKASVDFSISSNGVKTTPSIAGQPLRQNNNYSSSVFSKSRVTDRGQFIFHFVSFGLKEYYTRYWSDHADALYTYGPLYFGKNNNQDHYEYYNGTPDDGEPDYGESEFRSYANDVYDIPDVPYRSPVTTYDPWDQADPSKQVGGSLPSYDEYVVLGQGIGGAIEPNIFENGVIRGQNAYFPKKTSGSPIPSLPIIKYNTLREYTSTKKIDYRFKNDFSNSLTMQPGSFSGTTGSNLALSNNSVTALADGYVDTPNNQRLAGSKHVEWFTNKEIHDGVAKNMGFIDCYTNRTDRSLSKDIYEDYLQPEASVPVYRKNFRGKANGIITTDSYPSNIQETYMQPYRFNSLKPRNVSLAEKVGGYMITNESGVTYHYALPVYNYNEYTRLKLKKPMKGAATITETRNSEPYAYTWLLTAITGPDYVDRSADGSANGILDEYDFGYWVKFDYGKWTDSYQWRTPHTGYTSDFESEYETFSYGMKELYYLDAIETKTHKAIFVKSKRKDARGVTSRLEGGSNPRKYTMSYYFNDDNAETPGAPSGFRKRGSITWSVSPVSTMKLDAIYLFDKKDLAEIPLTKAIGDKYDLGSISNPHTYPYVGESYRYQFPYPVGTGKVITIRENEDNIKVKYHNGDLVYDDEDIAILQSQNHQFKQKALRTIEFETDYSLSYGVPNSFDSFSSMEGRTCVSYNASYNYDCLEEGADFDFEWPFTVKSECQDSFLGASPSCCNYSDTPLGTNPLYYARDKSAFYSFDPLYNMRLMKCSSPFIGADDDQITYKRTGKLTLKKVKILGRGGVGLIPPTSFTYAKNPGYSAGKYDDWGFYKSDYKDVRELEGDAEQFTYDDVTVTYQTGQLYKGSRRITEASAQNTDAWSLSSVTSPLGGDIKIAYESNTVNRSVLNNGLVFSIDKLVRRGTGQVDVYFKEKGVNLPTYFSPSGTVNIQSLIISNYSGGGMQPYSETYINAADQIAVVSDKFITINSASLNDLLRVGRSAVISGSSRTVTPYFIAGSIYIAQDEITDKYAGGIRVKSISVNEFGGHVRSTNYSYTKPGSTVSSGVTSFQPFDAVGINFPTDVKFFNDLMMEESWEIAKITLMEYRTAFQHRLNRLYEDVLIYAREAPGPGALYEYVTVQERYDDNDLLQRTQYRFKPFEKSMVGIDRNSHDNDVYLREFTVYNNAVDVGNLLEKKVLAYDDKILHQTSYGYLFDDIDENFELSLKEKKQGIVEQAFHKYISLKEYNEDYGTIHAESKAILTKRIDRSNVITSVKEVNGRTGQISKTQFQNFDFYSGQATDILSVEPSGVQYRSLIQPAYVVPEYSGMTSDQITAQKKGMGLRVKNPKNKHMLTQEAASYTYKVGAPNGSGLLGVSAQTWTDEIPAIDYYQSLADSLPQSGVWRKNASFTFIGDESVELRSDGMYPVGSYTDFVAWKRSDPTSVGWQMNNKVTLYDLHSNALEAKDINGQYVASIMTDDGSKVAATISNSRYSEFAFSGAEGILQNDRLSNLLRIGSGAAISSEKTHTGDKAIRTDFEGFIFESDITVNKRYNVTVWSSSPEIQLKYTNGNSTIVDFTPDGYRQVGDWYLFSTSIFLKNPHVKVWCQAAVPGSSEMIYFDDFRFHPFDASMNSYVYKTTGELSHILDKNNFYTMFEYDAMGRLVSTRKETLKGVIEVNEMKYRYKNQAD